VISCSRSLTKREAPTPPAVRNVRPPSLPMSSSARARDRRCPRMRGFSSTA
jgi:hypothetical protein